MVKQYVIYLELDGKRDIAIGTTNSADIADSIYAMYINQIKNGLVKYSVGHNVGRITKVSIFRRYDKARFSFSLTEGFKEEFKKAA